MLFHLKVLFMPASAVMAVQHELEGTEHTVKE